MKIDYIIVGLGLAGMAFAEEALNNGKTVMVFENASQTSSLIAGGVYNPVILKRFTPAWNAHEQLQYALPFYDALATKLAVDVDTKFATKKMFTSVADENNWFVALDKPNLGEYMNTTIERSEIPGVLGTMGFGTLRGTGRLKTKELVAAYQQFLESKQSIRRENFDYNQLVIGEEQVSYKDLEAGHIVFCEGYGIKGNPFFNHLPLMGTKGEIMDIHAPDLKINFLLKAAVFVMPLGNDHYKVGATFNWTDKTSEPTEEGRSELVEKLDKVISVPYTIVKQSAGIRPTVKDRRPLVGTHPDHQRLAVLNGLGTRGVLIAPTVAKELFSHIEHKTALDSEIAISRFA